MKTRINGRPDVWLDDVLKEWQTRVCPKLKRDETCDEANFFTPRPYVDRWNTGSRKTGFVYTVQPGNRVCIEEWTVLR